MCLVYSNPNPLLLLPSQLEIEANEKLSEITSKLGDARGDKAQSERARKFKENIDALRRLYPGVHGRILDLCKPSQRKYETAISTILGKNMDAVVVDSERTAIECIKYMRDHRAGMATFIPLDNIQVKPVQEKYRAFVKGARLALDVVQFDGVFERAVKYVVGNALVADSLDIARHVVYEKKQEVKGIYLECGLKFKFVVVTLDGTVLHKAGLITGGQGSSSHAQRWEEKDLDGTITPKTLILLSIGRTQETA